MGSSYKFLCFSPLPQVTHDLLMVSTCMNGLDLGEGRGWASGTNLPYARTFMFAHPQPSPLLLCSACLTCRRAGKSANDPIGGLRQEKMCSWVLIDSLALVGCRSEPRGHSELYSLFEVSPGRSEMGHSNRQ